VNHHLTASNSKVWRQFQFDEQPDVLTELGSGRQIDGGAINRISQRMAPHYRPDTPRSMLSHSTRSPHCPHKVSHAVEGLVVRLRRQSGFGTE